VVMIMYNTLVVGAVVATITAWIKLHRNQPSWLWPLTAGTIAMFLLIVLDMVLHAFVGIS
jgi:hypothetical protein